MTPPPLVRDLVHELHVARTGGEYAAGEERRAGAEPPADGVRAAEPTAIGAGMLADVCAALGTAVPPTIRVALAAAEYIHGSPLDPGRLEVTDRDRSGWTITGWRWVAPDPGVGEPTHLMLPVAFKGALGLALVPTGHPGVALPAGFAPGRVHLRAAPITPDDLLGPVGAVEWAYATAVTRARLRLAARLIGACRGALRAAVDHADSRHQFNRPLSANQAVGLALAASHAQVEAAWLVALRVAREHNAGAEAGPGAASALGMAAQVASATTRLAVRVHGARGLLRDCVAQRYAAATAAEGAALGTVEVLRREAVVAGSVAHPGARRQATGQGARRQATSQGTRRQATAQGARHRTAAPEFETAAHVLVERQAQRTPDAVALSGPAETVT